MSRTLLDILVVVLATSLLLILALGGIDYRWGVIHVRLHDWVRPLVLFALALTARAWLARGVAAQPRRAGRRAWSAHVATRSLLALLLAVAAVYAHYHVRVAGGLDSYGYVSAASLLASGTLTEQQKLVSLLPFKGASTAAAPFGYVPGPDGHTSSPRFPLGLPAVMALFMIFGPNGPFFAPLVMAYATMFLAFLLGSEPDGWPHIGGGPQMWGWPAGQRDIAGGLFAAALVAVDPLMVHYGTQPMSDVPATFWLAAAVWLRLRRQEWPLVAGLCAGMAFLTRPALLVAVVVLGLVTLNRRSSRHTIVFGAVIAAFVGLQMALNAELYGSVSMSGYGPASYMFELSAARVRANVLNFAKWLTYSHTVLIWLLWPAALAILRQRTWAWQISAVAAAAAAPYLFYLVFDDWESSRFLLPAIVLVLILSSRALSVVLASTSAWRGLALLLIAVTCAGASHRFLQREGSYGFGGSEAKFPLAGEWISTHTSERAVVLAGLHSGSIKFYGRRETIRWDQIPPDKLEPTLQSLVAAGYEPYLALDMPSEPPLFEERFHVSLSEPSTLTEPIARVRVVHIYRFLAAR